MQVFFHPEIYVDDFRTPLPDVIDMCVQSAPIDTRRGLYKVLSSNNVEHTSRYFIKKSH